MVICKDLLDPGVLQALVRAGANILAVPAMSDTTDDYPPTVSAFVGETQGFAVVANNPTKNGRGFIVPAAVFGQPIEQRRVMSLPESPDESVGRAVGIFRPGLAGDWRSIESY